MSVASSVTAQHLHRQRSPSLHYQSISLVASGNLLFMGSILIFKSLVFIHGHHIFSMHAYIVSWHGISNPPWTSGDLLCLTSIILQETLAPCSNYI